MLSVLAIPLVGDDHGHHFAGAGPERGEADVAVDALRQHVGVADAARHQHGVVHHLLAGLGDELPGLGNQPAHAGMTESRS